MYVYMQVVAMPYGNGHGCIHNQLYNCRLWVKKLKHVPDRKYEVEKFVNSQKFVPRGPKNNKSVLVQIVVWHE